MERRFRRQESASSGIDTSGFLRREMLCGSANQSRHPSQIFAINKEWQDYITAMEGEHTELRQLYKTQSDELSSLRSLLAEQPVKDALIDSLASRVQEYEACMKELLGALTNNEKRHNRDAQMNQRTTNQEPLLSKSRTKDVASSLPGTHASAVALMDAIRDAALRHQQSILYLRQKLERNEMECQELERKLAATKCMCTHEKGTPKAKSRPLLSGGVSCECFVPSCARELSELRVCVEDLEKQLLESQEREEKLKSQLQSVKQDAKATSKKCQMYAEQLEGLRALVDEKEKELTELKARYHAKERNLTHSQQVPEQVFSLAFEVDGKTGIHVEDMADTLLVTRHRRFLAGKSVALAFLNAPEEFGNVVLTTTSSLLRVPRDFLRLVDVQPMAHRHGVSLEIEVRHSASVKGDAIDSVILGHPYHELQELKERALEQQLKRAETATRHAEEAILAKSSEIDALQKKADMLQIMLEARDREQQSIDGEVELVLEEAKAAVENVYADFEAHRSEVESTSVALHKAREDAAAQLAKLNEREKELEKALRTAAMARAQLKRVEEGLLAAEQGKVEEVEKPLWGLQYSDKKKHAQETAINTWAGCTVENFALKLPLPSEMGKQEVGVLFAPPSACESTTLNRYRAVFETVHHLLLCEACMTTGTVPVRVLKFSISSEGGSNNGRRLFLSIKLELVCFPAPDTREAFCHRVAQKLSSCPFKLTLGYLQDQIEALQPLANAALEGSNPRASTISLRKLLNRLESRLGSGGLATEDRETIVGVRENVDLLITRVYMVETALRQAKLREKRLTEEDNVGQERLRTELPSDLQPREDLQRQLLEMETDMNDLAKIQASLQASLEAAQTKLRAEKQDNQYLRCRTGQIQEEAEQLRDENRRLRASAAAATAENKTRQAKAHEDETIAEARISGLAESNSVIITLRKTGCLLQDLVRMFQRRGAQSTSHGTELLSGGDLSKASMENYLLARQVYSTIVALFQKRKSPSKQSSAIFEEGAALSNKPTPAGTGASGSNETTTKEYSKVGTRNRYCDLTKGGRSTGSSLHKTIQKSRDNLGRADDLTTTRGTGLAFARSNTAICALSQSPAKGISCVSPSKCSNTSTSPLHQPPSPLPCPNISEPQSAGPEAWTQEERFVSPVLRPPPVLESRPGDRSPRTDAALHHWHLPRPSGAQSFHRSYTATEQLGYFRRWNAIKERGTKEDTSTEHFIRTLSGHRYL